MAENEIISRVGAAIFGELAIRTDSFVPSPCQRQKASHEVSPLVGHNADSQSDFNFFCDNRSEYGYALRSLISSPAQAPEPTAADREDAQKTLKGMIDPAVAAVDRNYNDLLIRTQSAILGGQPEDLNHLVAALGELKKIRVSEKKAGDDNLRLAVESVEHRLQDAGAGVHMMVHDGKVVIYQDHQPDPCSAGSSAQPNTALVVNPSNGSYSVRIINDANGLLAIKPDEVISPGPEEVLHTIGNAAVNNIEAGRFITCGALGGGPAEEKDEHLSSSKYWWPY
jgi:hypothetical protein